MDMTPIDPRNRSSAEFDAYAGSYDAAVNRSLAFMGVTVDYFTRVKAGYTADLIAQHFGPGIKPDLLDIGCGVGNYHALLAGAANRLAGCDVSVACLETAAARNPGIDYRHYAGDCLPFADASFDCATAICVMHHVAPDHWRGFATEMRRVLRPGGLALVFEHNPRNPLTQRVVSNCAFDADAVLLKQGTARDIFADAGFADAAWRSILSVPSMGPWSRRLDAMFSRLPLGAQYYVRAMA